MWCSDEKREGRSLVVMEVIMGICVVAFGSAVLAEKVQRFRSGEPLWRGWKKKEARIAVLKKERDDIAVEMERFNSPATFVQFAKLQRQVRGREKEIKQLKGEKLVIESYLSVRNTLVCDVRRQFSSSSSRLRPY